MRDDSETVNVRSKQREKKLRQKASKRVKEKENWWSTVTKSLMTQTNKQTNKQNEGSRFKMIFSCQAVIIIGRWVREI